MSEKNPTVKNESLPSSEQGNNKLEKTKEVAKKSHEKSKSKKHEHADNLDKIRTTINEESSSSERKTGAEKIVDDTPDKEKEKYISKDLMEHTYQRTLSRTRGKLSSPMKAFSKTIHNPIVETTSELAEKTIARPSGILSGGIAAFLGSSVLLWIAKHYGYEYNFLVFAILFVLGFFIGLLLELLIKAIFLRRKSSNSNS